ncbi:MAG: DUF3604 domain-containing protein [Reichenbachiella sp.]
MKNHILIIAALCLTSLATAQVKNPWDRQVYFGEQHLHTEDSPDAFAMGVRNTQDDAYNYMKGKPIKKTGIGYASEDMVVQKKTPFDWGATTDHALFLGLLPLTLDQNGPMAGTEIAEMMSKAKTSKELDAVFGYIMSYAQVGKVPPGMGDLALQKSAWERQKAITNKHNEPGKFTTLIAFEWTSIPQGQNLHRNVFFRDDQGPDVVFSTYDSQKPEDLWTYMEVQRKLGHEVFAIPHNGNVSNSLMYAVTDSHGLPIDALYAKRRMANEVATEIIQTKGQSDTHPAMSPNDEFAEFEIFENLLGTGGQRGLIDHSYVRQGLINGVGFQEAIGVNPFKYGIVAGSDAHSALTDNEEFNYHGVHGVNDDSPARRLSGAGQTAGEKAMVFGTPGITAVWADENTRPGIFDGIKRKETYGTSGTFIRLRFFGGWNYEDDIVERNDYLTKAYSDGVPMGGDLPVKKATDKAPRFIVQALKDPNSGNLDRVQIVKGWYKGGYGWEKVYDVVWSDKRNPDPKTGKLPAVGSTVNVKNATYKNTIGDTQLSAVWTDPDFDEALHVVYYVRVLEIPTPRWSTYDAKALGIDVPEGLDKSIQERAWSSPIWYTPEPALIKKAPVYPGLRQVIH